MIDQRALLASHADIVRRKAATSLDTTAIRMRAPGLDDLFTHLASDGRLSARGLREALELDSDDDLFALIDSHTTEPEWLVRLGRVIALRRLDPSSERSALRLIRTALRCGAPIAGAVDCSLLLAQLLLAQREFDDLRRRIPDLPLDEPQLAGLRADLVNPFVAGGDPVEWLDVVGDFFPDGADLRLDDDGAFPFDRVRGTAVRRANGPEVTVVISCYEPTADLVTAVRSIVAQSWRKLQILVVDDGSSSAFRPILDTVASLDGRIRVLRNRENLGTYACRNLALSFARGEFLTFQDSDDWSHPLRIEVQVSAMLRDPSLPATLSRCLRVDDDLVINDVGYPPVHVNTSSLMFRISETLGAVGYFDPVRKGADTEYIRRMSTHFGSRPLIVPQQLALVRRRPSSLSRPDFGPGWKHPRRVEYQESYTEWHGRIRRGTSSAFVSPSSTTRPFPAPNLFRLAPSKLRTLSLDAVLIGDWRADGGPQRSMLQEIAALVSDGAKVGVAHMEAVRFMTTKRRPLCAPIRELIRNGTVQLVHADDPVEVDLAILRYPPILQFPPALPVSWRVERMWIVANEGPSDFDGSDVRYLPAECTDAARHLFGVEPVWVPQGPMVRSALAGTPGGEQLDIADFDNPGILDLAEWKVERNGSAERPVVGRYSRDNPLKFPATADDLLSVYDDPRVEVMMMGATKSVALLLDGREAPDNWTLFNHGALDVKEFLSRIDFFVYFDNPNRCEAFGRSMLEAAASGCVVILPERFRPTFGDSAVYCEPHRAIDVVTEHFLDRDTYERQVATSDTHIDETFSREAFLRRVKPFLVPSLAHT